MKKLSLIAGLACLATVGGVFGAWTFGTATRTAEEQTKEVSVAVESDVQTYQGISLAVTGTMSLTIDQEGTDSFKFVVGEAENLTLAVTDETSYPGGATVTYTTEVTASFKETGKLDQYFDIGAIADLTGKNTTLADSVVAAAITAKNTVKIENAAAVGALETAISGDAIVLTFVTTVTVA